MKYISLILFIFTPHTEPPAAQSAAGGECILCSLLLQTKGRPHSAADPRGGAQKNFFSRPRAQFPPMGGELRARAGKEK